MINGTLRVAALQVAVSITSWQEDGEGCSLGRNPDDINVGGSTTTDKAKSDQKHLQVRRDHLLLAPPSL